MAVLDGLSGSEYQLRILGSLVRVLACENLSGLGGLGIVVGGLQAMKNRITRFDRWIVCG